MSPTQISFDIAKQLGHGALASGILVAASQVFQPFLALLARWLVIGTSYLVVKKGKVKKINGQHVSPWWKSELVLKGSLLVT